MGTVNEESQNYDVPDNVIQLGNIGKSVGPPEPNLVMVSIETFDLDMVHKSVSTIKKILTISKSLS